MKTKYTLSIADLQVSVVTDATPAEVEKIRGILDRRMREIYLKSRCPKTEAAILCAMTAIAERMELQDRIPSLEESAEKSTTALDALQKKYAAQAAELERLRGENELLRSLIAPGTLPAIAPDPIHPTDFLAEVADAQNLPTAQSPVSEPEEIPADAPRKGRRMGGMFDLLAFNDAD